MRSKKSDLETVRAECEGCRAKPRGRLMPAKLWRAAVALLDRYSPSTICRHLGLSLGRFKQIREARGGAPGERRPRRRRTVGRASRRGLHLRTAPQRARVAASDGAFVELPSLSVAGGGLAPTVAGMPRGTAGVRLTLESAAGTLSVCRFVLGVLRDGSQA